MLLVLDKIYPSSKAGVIANGVDSCFTHLCSWWLTKARNTNLGRFLSAFEWICFPNVTAWGSSWQPVLPLPREAFLEFGWVKIAAKGGNWNSLLPGQHCLAEVSSAWHFLWEVSMDTLGCWRCARTRTHCSDQSWGCCFLIHILSSRDFGASLVTKAAK